MNKYLTFVLFILSICLFASCIDKLLPGESYLILKVDNQSGEDVYCDVFSKKKDDVRVWRQTDVPTKIPSSKSERIICFYDMVGGSDWAIDWTYAFMDYDTVFVVFDKDKEKIREWQTSQNIHLVDKVLHFTIDDVPRSKSLYVLYDGR